MNLKINNNHARRFWLFSNGLGTAPLGDRCSADIVADLGFIQLDTIRNIVRAHDHIVWSRNRNYREGQLLDLLKSRKIFEHFTHDASVLPMETLPMWQRQFKQLGQKVHQQSYYRTGLSAPEIQAIVDRIKTEGSLSTHAFKTKTSSRKMWARPPHKVELDKMWYAGRLATSHRDGFSKVYDLAERVFPRHLQDENQSDRAQIDWLCRNALQRLGFANIGEIARFWGAVSITEVRHWAARANLQNVTYLGVDRTPIPALALAGFEQILETVPASTTCLRIINPFDPATRDRERLLKLFGFDYKIEIFVPAAKRKWGYYVYPILEGDRFIGRIDLKGDRKNDELRVINLWAETNIIWTQARLNKLNKELARLASFSGVKNVHWLCDRPAT